MQSLIKAKHKSTTKVLAFIVLLILPFISSCTPFYKIDEYLSDNYFNYAKIHDSHSANGKYSLAVAGLTKEGCKQNVLVIPEVVSGYPVEYIGIENSSWLHTSYSPLYTYENLKKLYIPRTIKKCFSMRAHYGITRIFFLNESMEEEWESLSFAFGYTVGYDNLYVSKNLYDSDEKYQIAKPATVSYYLNYETLCENNLYYLDDAKQGDKLEMPTSPSREGYAFDGWYREPDCYNEWIFEDEVYSESDQEVKLYAKWVSNHTYEDSQKSKKLYRIACK